MVVFACCTFEHIVVDCPALWLNLGSHLGLGAYCASRHVKPNYACDPYISHTFPMIYQYYPSNFLSGPEEGATSLATLNTLVSASHATLEMTMHSVFEMNIRIIC